MRADAIGQGLRRGQGHGVVDVPGLAVQDPPEKTGKDQGHIGLIGKIGPVEGHDPHPGLTGLFRGDLRYGRGHGQDYRVLGHMPDHLPFQNPGRGQSDKHVGPFQGPFQSTGEIFRGWSS